MTAQNVGVLVQVADLRDHAKTYARGEEACAAMEPRDHVKEVAGYAAVAFRYNTDAT